MSRTSLAVLLVALLGAGLRGVAAWAAYPWPGDPAFSYCYRGLLLSHGEASGLFLMWHYPGYPCLIAAVLWLGGGLLSPYSAGLLLSQGASLGLVFLVDRMVRPYVELPATRVVIASFLALYENLVMYASGPLTEPVYLVLVYAALALALPQRVGWLRALGMGLLLGLACTIRSEGLAPGVGLLGLVGLTEAWRTPDGSRRRAASLVLAGGAGLLASSGWVLFNLDYVRYAYQAQTESFTVPPAHGLAANAARVVECVYVACTMWLPHTLLLPFWLLLSVGLFGALEEAGKRRVTLGLLAVVLPSLAGVTLSIMHKRTGSFLLPAAAVWVGFGVEFLLLRTPLGRGRYSAAAVVGLVMLLTVGQAGRLVRSLRAAHYPDGPAAYVQGRLLKEAAAPCGKVWAFGGEPEVYQAWQQPVLYPFRTRAEGYQWLYRDLEGAPAAFVGRLRKAGFSYLAFAVAKDPPDQRTPYEEQDYGPFASQPLREDLLHFIQSGSSYGLELVGRAPADRGKVEVCVYRIRQNPPRAVRGK
jgi:hypothetical protein